MDQRHRILIADDDRFCQGVVAGGISRADYDVVLADDGRKALKLLRDGGVDVAIVDFHLPQMGAAELMSAMRGADISTPVIIVTADDTIETERRARSLSAACFFVKPFSTEDLLSVVVRLMQPNAQGAPGPTDGQPVERQGTP